MAESGAPILLDLENVSVGDMNVRRCTDFARLTNTDFQSVVTAYGGHDVTTTLSYRTLADIQELRWVCFVLSKSGTKRQCRRGDPPPNRLTARRLPCLWSTMR
jgi:hypothetical protein